LQALADLTRLQLISLLAGGPQCAQQLSQALGLSSAVVHHHLQRLFSVGVIRKNDGLVDDHSLRYVL
jgi:DNA-binding transcriptional ArsR family regulator